MKKEHHLQTLEMIQISQEVRLSIHQERIPIGYLMHPPLLLFRDISDYKTKDQNLIIPLTQHPPGCNKEIKLTTMF